MTRFAAAVLLGVVAGCGAFDDEFAVGTLERDRIELIADSDEPIIAIHVREGDRVAAGTALISQDPSRPRALLAKAQAERDLALAKLVKAETGPRAQAIERARARLAGAESSIATLERELKRQKSLIERHYASESRVDLLEGDLEEALARREEITAELEELLEGTRAEEIDEARAAVHAANAAVTDLQITVERATLSAPVAGVVETVPYELGERPRRGETVVSLLADGRTYARVHVPQPLRTRLKSGAVAEVRIDGFEAPFPAHVRWISSDAAFTPYYALTQHDRSRLSYLAEVDLDDAPELAAGIPVEVRFPDLEQ